MSLTKIHFYISGQTLSLVKKIPLTFASEDSFALISTWSYMIEGTGKCYSQRASRARSFIKDLFTQSAEDTLDPYSSLDSICQEWRLDPFVFPTISLTRAIPSAVRQSLRSKMLIFMVELIITPQLRIWIFRPITSYFLEMQNVHKWLSNFHNHKDFSHSCFYDCWWKISYLSEVLSHFNGGAVFKFPKRLHLAIQPVMNRSWFSKLL